MDEAGTTDTEKAKDSNYAIATLPALSSNRIAPSLIFCQYILLLSHDKSQSPHYGYISMVS